MLRRLLTLLQLEYTLLWRRPQEWLYPCLFFMMVTSVLPIMLPVSAILLTNVMLSYFWVVALFCSLLAVQTLFTHDLEDGYLEQMIFDPLPCAVRLAVMLFVRCSSIVVPLLVFVAVFGVCMHLSARNIAILSVGLLFGVPILFLLGGLCVALTLGLRQQGVLFSILLLPFAIPVLMLGANSAERALTALPYQGPLTMLVGLCILAWTCLPSMIMAAISIGLDE